MTSQLARAIRTSFVVALFSVALARPAQAQAASLQALSGSNQNATAGATLPNPLVVQALDATNAPVAGVLVQFAISSNDGVCSPTSATTDSNGKAQTNVTLGLTTGASTITASATGFTSATFTATGTPIPTVLVFTTQPGSTTAGASIAPAVVVTAQDGAGNTASSYTGPISIALAANPGGATLSGTTTVNASGGAATFSNLSLNASGIGYTVVASASGLTGATSSSFTINAGAPATLVFTTQPTTAPILTPISPAIVVTARDALGNTATGFTGTVSLQIGANPGGSAIFGTPSATASSGVATFSNFGLGSVGDGYTLNAVATGLASAVSASFNIVPGPPAYLFFTTQPGGGTAGSAMPAIVVKAEDSQLNVCTNYQGAIKVALGSNPTGTTLLGTSSVNAVNGIATFSNVIINAAASGYTLVASVPNTSVTRTSTSFSVVAAPATHLAFAAQPSNATAGVAIAPAVVVQALDAYGNASGITGSVTIAIGSNPGGATLSGTTTRNGSNSSSFTFSGVSLNMAASGYTLNVSTTASGVSGATSGTFAIAPAAAASLSFSTQPSNVTAGAPIAPAVGVTALDAYGNTATSFAGIVTIALGGNPGGSTLSGTTSVTATSGVASFSSLSLNKAASGYTLAASSSGLTGATSASFAVTAGAPASLTYTTQPSTVTAGFAISPAVVVKALDAYGNPTTGLTGTVSIALGANPGGSTLSGTTSVTAASGAATFSSLSLNKAASGYTLTASASGLTSGTSASFSVVAASASALTFSTQPVDTVAGSVIAPNPVVTAVDAFGNPAAWSSTVTVALATNPAGGTLLGTTSVLASGGSATFSTLKINKAGAGYSLRATSGVLTSATSATFSIFVGAPAVLQFTVQPTTTTAGNAIAPAPAVAVRDSAGNVVTSYTTPVSIALSTNPTGATLQGTRTATPVNGIATFSNLSITNAAPGYILTPSSSTLPAFASSSFTITAGSPVALAWTTQPPSSAQAGSQIRPVMVVTATDSYGNAASGFSGTVTLSFATNPAGGTLTNPSIAASSGVASFYYTSINRAGSGYSLAASAPGMSGATSTTFSVVPNAPAVLVFTQQPTNATAGSGIAPAVQVSGYDSYGNFTPSFGSNVTIGFGSNPTGATLAGTLTVAAVNGVATFSNLSIVRSGTGYTLTAFTSGFTLATSTSFNVATGPASALAFTRQPSNVAAGAAISPAVVVAARDAYGNTVASYGGNITVSLGTNPGADTLSGTTTVAAVSGSATFSTLSLKVAANGYTLAASASGLTGATSTAFNVTPGTTTALRFSTQPSSETAGSAIAPTIAVTAIDAWGNATPAFTGNVSLSLASNPGGGTLGGTLTVAAAGGTASFTNVFLTKAASGYTLAAAASGLTGATSSSFNVTPAAATALAFATQPSNTPSGAAISPAVVVTARDVYGNTATGFAGSIAVALGANPGSDTLGGTLTVTAAGGSATFADLTLTKAASGYTLVASATGLTATTSASFGVTGGPAASLVFATQPSSATAGSAIAPALAVTGLDAQGNVASGFTATVTIALGANPGADTLGGTVGATPVSGTATFPNVVLHSAASGVTLVASANGLPSVTSSAFNVIPGAAAALVFVGQPSRAPAQVALAPAVQVAVEDACGNRIATGTSSIALSVTSTNGASIFAGGSASASNGIATFANLAIDRTGTGYSLVASSAGLANATSTSFDVGAWNAKDGLGQLANGAMNFTGTLPNAPAATAIASAGGLALDTANHRLYVSDSLNGRILVFALSANDDFTGMPRAASWVIGAPDFSTPGGATTASTLSGPQGLALDAATRLLYVADTTNSRVMVFDTTNLASGMSASFVLGSVDFATMGNSRPATASSLTTPSDVAVDSAGQRLFVCDSGNNRVLVFPTASLSNGMSASAVLGQPDFATTSATYVPSVNGAWGLNLDGSAGLAFDPSTNRLYVADDGNSRVLVFGASAIANGMNASWVIGQTDFNTATSPAATATQLRPGFLAVDATNSRLYVDDRNAARVLVFDTSVLANGEAASFELGQVDFTSINPSQAATSSSINGPSAIALEPALGHLWIGDTTSRRVLEFDTTTLANGASASDGLGHLTASGTMDFTRNAFADSASGGTLSGASGVALDAAGHRLFVADGTNGRVLVYGLSGTNDFTGVGRVATLALGEPDLTTVPGPDQYYLDTYAVLYDGVANRLYVGKYGSVVVYDAGSFQVIGTIYGAPGGSSFFLPQGLALDSAGQRLFVADSDSNRVLVYDVTTLGPNGATVTHELGQPDMTTHASVYPPTAASLSSPSGLAYDAATSRLFVADGHDNRVLVYNVATITDGMAASNVLGQSSFTSAAYGSNATGLAQPAGLAFDAARNRLLVSTGAYGGRVVVYPVAPGTIANGESAIQVIGQGSLGATTWSGVSAASFGNPNGLCLDPASPGNVFVSDSGNNRLLLFQTP